MSGNSSRRVLFFAIDFDQSTLSSVGQNDFNCFIESTTNSEIIQYQVNWRFLDESPYTASKSSIDNYKYQEVRKNNPAYGNIDSIRCNLDKISVKFYTRYCGSLYKLKSLKGAVNLSFCEKLYFDISYKRHMIYASKSVPDNGYYYQIPVKNSTNILYGKFRNNCKCWDGDLNTSRGYNSCFPDPVTNQKCRDGYRLEKYSVGGGLLEDCVLDVDCSINCRECNTDSECIDCLNSEYNVNYINYFTESRFCGNCASNCFSCWGPNDLDCHCHADQFGYEGSAFYIKEFHLCVPSLVCPDNCVLCSSQVCLGCSNNYFLDPITKTCLPVNTRSCAIYKEGFPYFCLECVQGYFMTEKNYCESCPSNCLHCVDFSTCVVCENDYRKYLNKCISYSPNLFSILENANIQLQTNTRFENTRINYHILKFYDVEKNKVLDYSYSDEIYSQKMRPMTQKQYLDILSSYTLEECDRKLSIDCIFLRKSKFQVKTILHTKNQINQNTSCLRFKRINQCSECLPYYYLNIFTKKCVKIDSLLVEKVRYNKPQNQYQPFACRSNYFLNLKTKKCVENISNCLTLTKDNKCTLCKPGFSVSHNKTSCLKCPSNCLSCIDSAYCTECVKSHFLTFDRGNQYKHQVTKVNTRNTCKPCVFPCVECLSASFCKVCHLSYERYSKNVTTKLCRITCSMSTEFLENNQCVKCTKCDFCQVRGKVKCVNCPQCKSKCKFMLSEELHIQETSVSYFYVDTHNFILQNTDTLVKVQEKVQITKQTNTRYKVSYNGAATEETVSFFFNPSSVSSVSCVYNFEEPLVLTFTRKTQNIIGLNPENVVSVVYTLKLSALLTQLKANSGY